MPCAARAVLGVQRGAAILTPAVRAVDACHMIAELRQAIDGGDYRIDPGAVADAMLRQLVLPEPAGSEVLVSPQRSEGAPAGSPQIEPLPGGDAA